MKRRRLSFIQSAVICCYCYDYDCLGVIVVVSLLSMHSVNDLCRKNEEGRNNLAEKEDEKKT